METAEKAPSVEQSPKTESKAESAERPSLMTFEGRIAALKAVREAELTPEQLKNAVDAIRASAHETPEIDDDTYDILTAAGVALESDAVMVSEHDGMTPLEDATGAPTGTQEEANEKMKDAPVQQEIGQTRSTPEFGTSTTDESKKQAQKEGGAEQTLRTVEEVRSAVDTLKQEAGPQAYTHGLTAAEGTPYHRYTELVNNFNKETELVRLQGLYRKLQEVVSEMGQGAGTEETAAIFEAAAETSATEAAPEAASEPVPAEQVQPETVSRPAVPEQPQPIQIDPDTLEDDGSISLHRSEASADEEAPLQGTGESPEGAESAVALTPEHVMEVAQSVPELKTLSPEEQHMIVAAYLNENQAGGEARSAA